MLRGYKNTDLALYLLELTGSIENISGQDAVSRTNEWLLENKVCREKNAIKNLTYSGQRNARLSPFGVRGSEGAKVLDGVVGIGGVNWWFILKILGCL